MRPILLAAAVLVLSACGGEDAQQVPAAAPIPGGGLSIQQALDSNLDGPLLVRGYLIEREGELRLCEAILESSPPQCGEPSLRVEGPTADPSEQRVSLLGEVEGGTITVSRLATP